MRPADPSSLSAATPSPDTVAVGADTIILDVRTSQEYADGHLQGARRYDFNGGELTAALPDLDPHADYLLYCRSGNRSGQAVALMERAGFTHLTNLGSLEQAAQATRIEIVR